MLRVCLQIPGLPGREDYVSIRFSEQQLHGAAFEDGTMFVETMCSHNNLAV